MQNEIANDNALVINASDLMTRSMAGNDLRFRFPLRKRGKNRYRFQKF